MTPDHLEASGESRAPGRCWRLVPAMATAALVAAALPLSAQPAPSTPTSSQQAASASQWDPQAVSVKVGFTSTLADGKTGAASGYGTSAPNFRAGDSMTTGIHSGSFQLCGDTGMGAAIDPDRTDALHAWNVTVQPTAVAGDKVTLLVDWKRFDTTAEGRHDLGAADRRTITLNEGEHHVLDFVSAPNARPGTCVNMMIHVEAAVRDDPIAANTMLGYDLWLVDQDPGGRQATRHMEMAGKHRETISFNFVPIGWSSGGVPVADGARPDILIDVGGTIKGRLLPDGSVQVTVTPTRIVRIGERTGMTGYREQVLTAKPGETIRMDIPPSGPGAARTHRTSLSLTVRSW